MKLKLPKSYKDITLGQYEDIKEALSTASVNHYFAWRNVISICSGKTPEEIGKADIAELNQWVSELDWLTVECKDELVDRFSIDGKWYKVHRNINSLSTDMFIHAIKVYNETSNIRREADFAALFITYDGVKFNSDDYATIKDELFFKAPCNIMLPWSRFFFLFSVHYLEAIQQSLESQLKMKIQEITQEIQSSELGTEQ